MNVVLCILSFCVGFSIGYLTNTKDFDEKDNDENIDESSNYDYNALCDGEG